MSCVPSCSSTVYVIKPMGPVVFGNRQIIKKKLSHSSPQHEHVEINTNHNQLQAVHFWGAHKRVGAAICTTLQAEILPQMHPLPATLPRSVAIYLEEIRAHEARKNCNRNKIGILSCVRVCVCVFVCWH